MNYQETITYLYNQLPVYQQVGGVAYKEGLDNSLALDAYFDHPHRKYKTIHVAGTNGKGSTSHLLAAILQESGYKVGLYTSPHLVDFRERIRINGEKIEEQYVVDFVAKHQEAYQDIQPSFFELTMMMAFLYLAESGVDVAIIETGLGGRLDSTNIITPNLCAITNISIDHIQFLGNTLKKIATEKAGIIKSDIPIIIGEAKDEVRAVFEQKATEVGAPIIFAEDEKPVLSARKEGANLVFETEEYPNLKGELAGLAQVKNANTVLTVIHELKKIGYTIPTQAVYTGFAQVVELTGLMGRWQVISTSPRMVCDTGHNVGGMQYIVEQLASETYKRLHIIIGVVDDKDISTVLSMLPKDAVYYFTRAEIPRSLDQEKLADLAHVNGLQGDAYAHVSDALAAAQTNASTDDFIFIGGSNFIVADALIALKK